MEKFIQNVFGAIAIIIGLCMFLQLTGLLILPLAGFEQESFFNIISEKKKYKDNVATEEADGGIIIAYGEAIDADSSSDTQNNTARAATSGTKETRIVAPDSSIPSIYPVKNNFHISSAYGFRNDPYSGSRSFHHGIDIPLRQGTEVIATGSGRVVSTGFNRGHGNYIKISHEQGYESLYSHLSRISVRKGQNIRQGQVIGYSGNTGRSTGSHLHYQVNHRGRSIDPVAYVNSINRTAKK